MKTKLINKDLSIFKLLIITLFSIFLTHSAFSQVRTDVLIYAFSSTQKIPSQIGTDTCLIISGNQIRNENITINGGKLIINAPLKINSLIVVKGKVFINTLFSCDSLYIKKNGLLRNEAQIFAKIVQIDEQNTSIFNSGLLNCNKLFLHKNSIFKNRGKLVSNIIEIDDSSKITNSPNAFISSSSNILTDYRKVIKCYYKIHILKITDYINASDWLIFILYYLFIVGIIWFTFKKYNLKEINLFIAGFTAKIIAGLIGILIYGYYYKGGDVFEYFNSAKALNNLLLSHTKQALEIFMGDNSSSKLTLLEETSNYSIYTLYFRALNSFATVRIFALMQLLAANNLLASIIVVNIFSYIAIWKLYKVVSKLYPYSKQLIAFALLFFPSSLFWGSLLLKDTIVFACFACLIACLIDLYIFRNVNKKNYLLIILNIIIISAIKPYVLIAFIPFLGFLVFYHKILDCKVFYKKIKIIFICLLISGFVDWGYMVITEKIANSSYGSVEKVIDKAKETREDHLRTSLYGKNAYYLGEINKGIDQITVAPIAIFTGLFRPMPWDIGNILMIVPAVINSLILLFSIYVIWKTRNQNLLDDPLLLTLLGFIILYSYGIGISSTNFGALSRFQIMAMPYYILWLGIKLRKNEF